MGKNSIPETQNAEPQLRLLRAQRQLYGRAKAVVIAQIILTVAVPLTGALGALAYPDVRPYVALVALVISIVDIAILDRFQKRILGAAARVQEEFDSAVLELPWDRFNVGQPLDPEAIYEAASNYSRKHDDSTLRDWYPVVVGEVPLHLGRVICQRTNLWYDSKIRRHYGVLLLGAALGLFVVFLLIAMAGGLTLTDFVLTVMAPAAPFFGWSLREFHRQRDVADALDRVRSEAEALWERAKGGQCDPQECARQSREFQNAIFVRRATSSPIFSWVYWLLRSSNESQMNAGAEQLVQSAQDAAKAR